MRLYGETREILKGTESWKMYEVLLAIIGLISGCFAISVVPFIRKDCGERYLSWLNLFFGYTVVANFMFLGSMLAILTRWGGSQFMILFWLAFIVMSLYRRWEISRRNNAGVEWHSMYMGTSLLPLPFSEEKNGSPFDSPWCSGPDTCSMRFPVRSACGLRSAPWRCSSITISPTTTNAAPCSICATPRLRRNTSAPRSPASQHPRLRALWSPNPASSSWARMRGLKLPSPTSPLPRTQGSARYRARRKGLGPNRAGTEVICRVSRRKIRKRAIHALRIARTGPSGGSGACR